MESLETWTQYVLLQSIADLAVVYFSAIAFALASIKHIPCANRIFISRSELLQYTSWL